MSARRGHFRNQQNVLRGNSGQLPRTMHPPYSLRPGYDGFHVGKLLENHSKLTPAQTAILAVLAGTFAGMSGGLPLAANNAYADGGFSNANPETGDLVIPNYDGGKKDKPNTDLINPRNNSGKASGEKQKPSEQQLPLENIVSAQPNPNAENTAQGTQHNASNQGINNENDTGIYGLRIGGPLIGKPLLAMPGFIKDIYSLDSAVSAVGNAQLGPVQKLLNRTGDFFRGTGRNLADRLREIYGSKESLGYQRTFDRDSAVTESYRMEFKDGEVLVTKNTPKATQERDVTVLVKRDGRWQLMYGNLYGGKSASTLNDPASGTTTDGPTVDNSNGFPVTTTTTTTSDPRTETLDRNVQDGYRLGASIEAVESDQSLSPKKDESLRITLQGRYGLRELQNIVHTLDVLHQTDDVKTELGAPFNRTTITNVTTDVSTTSDVKTITVEKDSELQVYVMKKVDDKWSLSGRFGYSLSELKGKVRTFVNTATATTSQTDLNAPVTNTTNRTTLTNRKLELENDIWYMPCSFGLKIDGKNYTVTGELGYKITDGSNPSPKKDDVSAQGYFAVKSITSAAGTFNYENRGVNLSLILGDKSPETYGNLARLVAEEYGLGNNLLVEDPQREQMKRLSRNQTIFDVLYPTSGTGMSVFDGRMPIVSADFELPDEGKLRGSVEAAVPLTSSGAHEVVGTLGWSSDEKGYSLKNAGRVSGGFLTRLGKGVTRLLGYLRADVDINRGRDDNRGYTLEAGVQMPLGE